MKITKQIFHSAKALLLFWISFILIDFLAVNTGLVNKKKKNPITDFLSKILLGSRTIVLFFLIVMNALLLINHGAKKEHT